MEKQDQDLLRKGEYMNEEHIREIKDILSKWNPLGDQAINFPDLNNYETEAIDILFHIEIEFKQDKNSKKRIQVIVKEVLNEAFNLWLSEDDCEKPAELIHSMFKS
jgi:hypothetical protein